MISPRAAMILWALFFIILSPCQVFARTGPREGDPAPAHVFPAPERLVDRRYLGLAPRADGFRLTQVKAEALFIEFFNQRCRHCQKEAPNVNRLFELIQSRGLGERIKFLGVGAYNGRKDVELFKRRYQVPFPLIPDRRLEAFKALGGQGTPQFFVVRLEKEPIIAMIVSGFLPEPHDALEEIMRKTGLQTD